MDEFAITSDASKDTKQNKIYDKERTRDILRVEARDQTSQVLDIKSPKTTN